jgi:hypothetical protein
MLIEDDLFQFALSITALQPKFMASASVSSRDTLRRGVAYEFG